MRNLKNQNGTENKNSSMTITLKWAKLWISTEKLVTIRQFMIGTCLLIISPLRLFSSTPKWNTDQIFKGKPTPVQDPKTIRGYPSLFMDNLLIKGSSYSHHSISMIHTILLYSLIIPFSKGNLKICQVKNLPEAPRTINFC